MVKKKTDASQQELFARQAKLKDERTTILEDGNRLRNRVIELQTQREALSKRKHLLEVEIQENTLELCRLDQQLLNTIESKRSLEEKIKTMPIVKGESG